MTDSSHARPPNTTPTQTHQPHTITHLTDALNGTDRHVKTLIQSLPNDWEAYNHKGSLITKQQLLHCTWGEPTESDSLQAFQQAIITAIPPPTTTVTQYTTHLTSAICRDNTVWRHTIQNACQDQILPHPLFNPITILIYNIIRTTRPLSQITNHTTTTPSTRVPHKRSPIYTTHSVVGTRD